MYDNNGREIPAENVLGYYRYALTTPLPDITPEAETAEEFNITEETVLDLYEEWEADNNA